MTTTFGVPTRRVNSVDAIKYAAAKLRETTTWTVEELGECVADHDNPITAILGTVSEITELAELFGDPDTYSDGRRVHTTQEICEGLSTSHVWHPNPAAEKCQSWRGNFPAHDRDGHSPGVFQVTIVPTTQQIEVTSIRLADPLTT